MYAYKNKNGICFFHRKVVHPDDEVSIEFTMLPRRLGDRMIYATFSADECADFEGETTTFVVSKGDWEKEEEKKEEKEEKEEEKVEDEKVEDEKMEEEKVEKEETAETDGAGEERMEEGGESAAANETEEPVENGAPAGEAQ